MKGRFFRFSNSIFPCFFQELAELATKATDQAEESEGKFKACIADKENLLQKFSDEKQELLAKLNQLQDVINDKDRELKVSNVSHCARGHSQTT